ncbi:DUF1348 family protein, partial [Akkermansia sp.]|uniref:DUF1348 family protein n=1 Tax=Akkermansia sp. TaxID=1872421 RepID=UPI0025BB89A1
WQQQPQQDWQQQPQQDWQQQPQQDWQQEPQQVMYPPSSLQETSHMVQKTGGFHKGLLISASIAAFFLIAGAFLSYTFYGKGEKLLKRTNSLKSDIYALTDETTLLRKKYEPVKQTAEALAQTSEKVRQLQTSLEAKEKEVEKIRQAHSSTLSKLKNTQQAIASLEREKTRRKMLNERKNSSSPPTTPLPQNSVASTVTDSVQTALRTTSSDTSSSDLPPVGVNTVQIPKPPVVNPTPQLDNQMFQQGVAYLKARKTGDIAYLSKTFAPRSTYLYADGKEVSNQFIMDDIQKFWDKWPIRDYRLLKIAYSGNAVELIYFYECSNHSGKTIRGYTKEMWQTSPSGQIIQWNEVLNNKEAPDSTSGYRTLKLHY